MELLCLQGEVAVTIIGGSIHKPLYKFPQQKNNKMLQDVNLHPTAYVQSFILPKKSNILHGNINKLLFFSDPAPPLTQWHLMTLSY